MKRLFIRLLAAFGLAPARVVASQAQLIAELRAGSQAWKTKAGEALDRVKVLETELRLQQKHAEKVRLAAEKSGPNTAAYEELKGRLAVAERELAAAREHLMAIEVKLDILEGAANVLDVRTRAAVRQQARETGAPV